jgi:hypothetical protein
MRYLSGVRRPVDRCAFSVLHQIVWISEDVGYNVADAKRVDPDPVIDALQSRSSSQLCECAFGCGVGRDCLERLKTGVGTDVDNGATLVGNHRAHRFASVKERSGGVGSDDVIPVLESCVDDGPVDDRASVVDENIELAEPATC